MRSIGVSIAAARTASAFLNDTMPLNERYAPSDSARSRFVGSAGEAVEHGALGNARVFEHAERVVPRVAGVDHEREAELSRQCDLRGGTRLPARRPASACSRSRSRSHRWRRPRDCSPAPRARPTRRRASTRRGGATRRSPRRRRAQRRARSKRRRTRGRCRRTPPAPLPPARARSSAASAPPVSDGRWQWLSIQVTSRCGETAARPSRASSPRAATPTAAASGSRSSAGLPGRPSRRHNSADARGISGDDNSATTRNASRQSPSTAAVATVSPALLSAHGCLSSMYEFASRMRSQTAPKPFE